MIWYYMIWCDRPTLSNIGYTIFVWERGIERDILLTTEWSVLSDKKSVQMPKPCQMHYLLQWADGLSIKVTLYDNTETKLVWIYPA